MERVLLSGEIRVLKHLSQKEVEKIMKDDALQQMIKEGQQVFNRVNKRIRNIERNNKLISPAYNALKKKRGIAPRFGTAGTYHDLDSLQREIALAQAFDTMETSTVAGARSFTNNLRSQLKAGNGQKLSDEFIGLIFDALHALHERMPDTLYKAQLKYADYLDSIVETAENIDFSKLETAEQVEELVSRTIEHLSEEITKNINDRIDTLQNFVSGYNRLF